MARQAGQFGPVAQIPREARAVNHDELARPVADKLAAQHGHVRREAGAGADHQDVLVWFDLVECEHAHGLGAHVHPIAELEREQPRGQLTAHHQGQVELDVLIRAAFRRDRIGAADHAIRVGGGTGNGGGLGFDGSPALGRPGDLGGDGCGAGFGAHCVGGRPGGDAEL